MLGFRLAYLAEAACPHGFPSPAQTARGFSSSHQGEPWASCAVNVEGPGKTLAAFYPNKFIPPCLSVALEQNEGVEGFL